MAFFSVSLGFNKNWAGNRGISRRSFKTNKILHTYFSLKVSRNKKKIGWFGLVGSNFSIQITANQIKKRILLDQLI